MPRARHAPVTNAQWWRAKLAAKVQRDRDTDARLKALDWISLRFWEHSDMVAAADVVVEVWRGRR